MSRRCTEFDDCRAGRDCSLCEGAQVAPVGKRTPKHPPTPQQQRRRNHLKDLARAMLVVIVVLYVSAMTIALMAR